MTDNKDKKSTRNLVRGILAGFLFLYLLFGFLISNHLSANQQVKGLKVSIATREEQNFVSQATILNEVNHLVPDSLPVAQVNLSEIEHYLKNIVNIENARVNRTTQGNISIVVEPVVPVARIFNNNGESYYINRNGKKLMADVNYHVDVPVVMGNVDDSIMSATDLLPLLNFISNDTLWNDLTTAIKVENNHDVLLVPRIRGHVVNLGNYRDKNFENKFSRLYTMYKEVLPHKGWQYYDTISVKYSGQVIATRTRKRNVPQGMLHELADAEEVALENMMVDSEEQQ